MRAFNALTSLVFASALVTPLASLALFGYSDMAENPPAWSAGLMRAIAANDSQTRKALSRDLVTSTPAGMAAISARSWIDYEAIGFVHSDRVISGEGKWLFYTKQFADGNCHSEGQIRKLLMNIEAMRILAEAAGIRLIFSVSPDKSVVHPEKMGLYGSLAAGCKLTDAKRWRSMAKARGVDILDHLEPLAERAADTILYSPVGTHWNRYGRALAIRQLASFLEPDNKSIPYPEPTISKEKNDIDLLKMLRLDGNPTEYAPDDSWTKALREARIDDSGIMILHDSFYGVSRKYLSELLPLANMASYGDVSAALGVNRPYTSTLLINTVERDFFSRVLYGAYGWKGALGEWLIERNRATAHCQYERRAVSSLRLMGMEAEGDMWRATADPQIMVDLASSGASVCLRARLRTDAPGMTELFLPFATDEGDTFTYGMSIAFRNLNGTERELEIVLPARFAGRTVRIDPVTGTGMIRDLIIETGVAY